MASFMKKINLLIISLYYPPIRSIASNRIYSFAKYIDKDRYAIHVITFDEEGHTADTSTAGHLESVTVHRLQNRGLFRKASFHRRTHRVLHAAKAVYNRMLSMLVLDEYQDWCKRAIRKATELVEQHDIDVILSSYAPLASHLAALELKSRFPNLLWIADMRDEMSKNPFMPLVTRLRMKNVERAILSRADAVTSVSQPILDHFRSISVRTDVRYREIRNGYDFELPALRHGKRETFTITYTGSFYGSYTPHIFFQALERFLLNSPADNVRVRIVGPLKPISVPAAIRNIVSFEAPVSHEIALRIMQESDLLLLYHPANRRKGYYSGKLFEYMASLTPVLAVVDPHDVASKLIRDSRTGYVAANDDIAAIEKAIHHAYVDWQNDRLYNPDLEVVRSHHRKEQSKELQNLILSLIASRHGAAEEMVGTAPAKINIARPVHLPSTMSVRHASGDEWDAVASSDQDAVYTQTREWYELWSRYSRLILAPRLITFESGHRVLFPLAYSSRMKGLFLNHFSAIPGLSEPLTADILTEAEKRDLYQYILGIPTLTLIGNPYSNLMKGFPGWQRHEETHVIDLTAGFDAVFKNWSKGHSSAAKKGMREGVLVEVASDLETWRQYYQAYEDSLVRWGERTTSRYSWTLFELMAKIHSPKIRLWVAKYGDRTIAGCLCFYHNKHISYWHGAALKDYFHLRPVHVIQYHIMKDACQGPYRLYDLGSSGGNEGTDRFKRGFSTTQRLIPVYQRTSPVLRQSKKILGILKRFTGAS